MQDIDQLIEICKKTAQNIRIDAVELTYKMGAVGAHIGGGLSLAEVMAVLYMAVLNIDPNDLNNENRDRLIFSKGHGTLALYPAMKYAGILTQEELNTYKKTDTFLSAHPTMNPDKGIEFSSGSLGQGLSLGVGSCLALKRKGNEKSCVYVILGDGECNEGSVWEAAQSAAHFGCLNLIAVIDCNGLQYDGATETIMGGGALFNKWKSFGWEAVEVDGHDVSQLLKAFHTPHEKPLAILAHTVKGKGVSYMENNPVWHNHSLNDSQYEKALVELRKAE